VGSNSLQCGEGDFAGVVEFADADLATVREDLDLGGTCRGGDSPALEEDAFLDTLPGLVRLVS